MGSYYIGFDCGTQNTKVAIYNNNFECVAEETIPTVITYPRYGWVEMDADHYLESVRAGIAGCLSKSGVEPSEIKAICGDGIICGVVGVNAEGRAITPYIPYLDSRCTEDAEYIQNNIEPLWATESGNERIESYYPPVIVRWLLNNHSGFRQNGCKFLNNGPYVLSRLAGLNAKDCFIDHATLSGWLIGYDAIKKTWSDEQMKLLNIPFNFLPKIVKPWDIIGYVCDEEAAKTGLLSGTPVVAGAGDTMQSTLGCGLVENGMASDVAGTASMFTVTVSGMNSKISQSPGMHYAIGTLPDSFFYWGFIPSGGLSLRWFKDNVCGKKGVEGFYDTLNSDAASIKAGAEGVLFYPYLQGGWGIYKDIRGCFINMTGATDYGVLWRAVLESVAFEYLKFAQLFRDNGMSIDKLLITEGGSKSDVWNKIKSDMLSVEAYTLKKSEGALLSNIITAAYAVGDISSIKDKIIKSIEINKIYKPDPSVTFAYKRIFDVRQTILDKSIINIFEYLKGAGS